MRIWAHMSIAGGLEKAFARAEEIGSTTLQIFSKTPRGWTIPKRDPQEFALCREERKVHHQKGGLIHSNYLANLSKPFEECKTDIASIMDDFRVAHETWYEAINVHIGKGKGFSTIDEPMKNMAKNVEYILSQNKKNGYDVQFLFENTAGQWSELGHTIEQLSYFHKNYLKGLPVKFCIDTCHSFAGGIDITRFDEFIDEFSHKVGIDQLYSFHLNDSKAPMWSRLDRHASLGRWFIWLPTLAKVIKRAVKHDRPLFLETPDMSLRPEEISMVKKIAAWDDARVEKFHKKQYQTDVLKKFEDKGLF